MTIDVQHLIERYQTGNLDSIADALALLHQQGVFLFQVSENKRQIMDSFEVEEPENLAKRILEVRQTNRTLLALHELGRDIKKGIKRVEES